MKSYVLTLVLAAITLAGCFNDKKETHKKVVKGKHEKVHHAKNTKQKANEKAEAQKHVKKAAGVSKKKPASKKSK